MVAVYLVISFGLCCPLPHPLSAISGVVWLAMGAEAQVPGEYVEGFGVPDVLVLGSVPHDLCRGQPLLLRPHLTL